MKKEILLAVLGGEKKIVNHLAGGQWLVGRCVIRGREKREKKELSTPIKN